MESSNFEYDQNLLCPISRDKIENAVISEDGFTYDKNALVNWFANSNISPMLGMPLKSKNVIENKNINFLLGKYKYYQMRFTHLKLIKTGLKPYIIKPLPAELKGKIEKLLIEYFRLMRPLSELYIELETLISKYPEIPQLLLEYANMLRFGGQFDKSLDLIKKASEMNLCASIPKYMLARVVSVKGKPLAGKETIDEVQNKYPIFDHYMLEMRYLASACLNTESKSMAFNIVTAYLEVCPEDMRASLNQVYTLYTLQEDEKVLEYSKKFLDKYEYDACVVYYRGRAFGHKGNIEEAFKHFDIVLSRSKEPIFLAQCYYDKALLRKQDKEFAEMVSDLTEADKLYNKLNADIILADLYKSKKDWENGMKWLTKYGERIDKANDILFNRVGAEINLALGNKEAAISSYLMLIEKDGVYSHFYRARLNSLLENH